jgi:hypothetical protein
MIDFLLQHQLGAAVGMYWIFSAAVSSMPEPEDGGSAGYLWLYRFLHTIAGNITTALGRRIPGLKILIPLLLVPTVLLTTACAGRYRLHPGALNVTDSAAYDTLLVAEAAIDQARVENQTRSLPSPEKDALNTLIRSYNVARDSWLTYRGAIATNVPPDPYFQQLSQNLTDLASALRTFYNQKEVKK